MVESVPVSSWIPPGSIPASRATNGQSNRQSDFDNAMKRADSSRSSKSPAEDEASIEESEAGEAGTTESLSDRSGENAGRLRFDDLLLKNRASERELTTEAMASQASVVPVELRSDSLPQSTVTASSTSQTPLLVESVTALMMRLERMPELNAGQWQFNLLDDPAGISSLQLQRAINGSWKVSVSVLSGSVVEQEQHADELKYVLEQRGYTVESVQITDADPGDDVSAKLDES